MNKIFTPTVKRHLLSATTTFVSTFLLLLGTNLSHLDMNTITTSGVFGIIVVCARAAGKVVIESLVGGHADLQKLPEYEEGAGGGIA